ncbi:MAG TPA: prepilin-type N-terminal cleavage/methylation domain-containing protein [Candidatus Paceibacterota bacterium]|nr:prepilin-type N-terminal cleavage/methylation domain-containing protein [Candidatus Paceibacterota bacterium]
MKFRKVYSIHNGFSLVEMLIYIFLLSLLLIVVINSMVIIVSSYRNIKSTEAIESSGLSAMDRMETEIRNAQSVDAINSVFSGSGTSSILTINTSTTTPAKIKFYASSTILAVDEDGIYNGPLISSGVRLKTLIFRSISTSTSAAIKIELEIESGTGPSYKSAKFYDTAILRGSY